MRVTPPVTIDSATKLVSSTASEVHAPAAYSAATTYAIGKIVSVAADFRIYESLASGNIANTPRSSPQWWKAIGYDETAYSAGTTYATGATCSANHRVYQSLADANTGNALPVIPETQTTKWIDIGPTNKWAAFDLASNTQTVREGSLTMVIAPGCRVNTIGVMGLSASSITITATSVFGGGTVYGPVVIDLNIRDVTDAYDYAFAPFNTQPSVAKFAIPPYSDIIITVAISASNGNVKCGSVVVGTYVYVGDTLHGAKGDAVNFSTVDRDLWGNATLVPRRSIPKTNQSLRVASKYVNKVRAARTALNAVPAMWTGLDDSSSKWFDMLLILGIYKVFEINADQADFGLVTLELEEI